MTRTIPQRWIGRDYRSWCEQFDTLAEEQRVALAADVRTWTHRPRISVVMPVYNPRLEWLEQAVHSVMDQIYPDWELCIADDASTDPRVRALLQKLARREPRIKLAFRASNGHICAASNTALEMAEGEFVALLDHDDVLPAHALYWVARAVQEHPQAGLLYSDEDKMDEQGRRSSPYFKSAFNYDLFLSQNLVSHLGVYRRTLVLDVGRFRPGVEGSQDYDLALRCIERLQPHQIVHIARVLYHWRQHSQSTSMNMDAKPYAATAGEGALNAHLTRTGQEGAIRFVGHGYHYEMSSASTSVRVSVIICVRKASANIEHLSRSLREDLHRVSASRAHTTASAKNEPIELLWIAGERLTEAEDERLEARCASLGERWLGCRAGSTVVERVNAAARRATGEVLMLTGSDVHPRRHDALALLVAHSLRIGVGVVGVPLWERGGRVRGRLLHAGLFVDSQGQLLSAHYGLAPRFKGYFGKAVLNQNFHAVSAACVALRRSAFESVHGFRGDWISLRYAVADLCMRVQATGYRTLWAADAGMEMDHKLHDERWGFAASAPCDAHDLELWRSRWLQSPREDPHYSPQLSWEFSHFDLAWPPRAGHSGDVVPQGESGQQGAAVVFRAAPYVSIPWKGLLP
ncbi:glycosyltransferase [Diaphorobacter sp. HDW4A]|uniref:glycosyltransferase n=1 Tax=Diaphorobacter sp. HDW4A TaxID=2714924 RepID=UPI001408F872|nr:glycosyltransferase [Diaphorobacter sp. HDW4A]QIL78546.1 glycosyltransferase [Diaphorobacter sp. HDW4A]